MPQKGEGLKYDYYLTDTGLEPFNKEKLTYFTAWKTGARYEVELPGQLVSAIP